MALKIGINGFGRIGRDVFKACYEEIKIVGIGEIGEILLNDLKCELLNEQVIRKNTLDFLTKYDNVLSLYEKEDEHDNEDSSFYVTALSISIKNQSDILDKLSVPVVKVDHEIDRKTLEHMYENPHLLYALSPKNFELFVAEIYEGLGYGVEATKQTHDEGVDLYLRKNHENMPHIYAVQCKYTQRKRTKIGIKYVRELFGTLIDKKVTAGILITNSFFSPCALKFIKRYCNRLFSVDFNGLLALMQSYLIATA